MNSLWPWFLCAAAMASTSSCSLLFVDEMPRCRDGDVSSEEGDAYACVDGAWKEQGPEPDSTSGDGAADSASGMDTAPNDPAAAAHGPSSEDTEGPTSADGESGDDGSPDGGMSPQGADSGTGPAPAEPPSDMPVEGGAGSEEPLGTGMDAATQVPPGASCLGAQAPFLFRVDGDRILDAAGCPFVPQGYNAAVFYIAQPQQHRASFQRIAATRANAVRIVATTSAQSYWNSTANVQAQLVQEALDANLVPVLDMHDFGTCESDPVATWQRIADYWLTDEMIALATEKPAAWLNLASRMSFASEAEFLSEYSELVEALRARGVNNLIVVDAGGNCGQDVDMILNQGPALLRVDPNVVFAIHPFAGFASSEDLKEKFQRLGDSGLPVLVGAFSWNTPTAARPEDRINYSPQDLLALTEQYEMGWFFWSWYHETKPEQRAVDTFGGELNGIGRALDSAMSGQRAALQP